MASTALVVGGTSGIGRTLAELLAARGLDVVLTGRDRERAERVADQIGGATRGLALDLGDPGSIGAALASVRDVRHLVIAAIERDENRVREYDVAGALRLVTLKLVGYTEVVHTLLPRLTEDASVLLFGGLALRRPYPGSTTVTTVNGGITGLVHTLAVELAPIRVNGIHPGVVGDSPYWSGKTAALDDVSSRTPIGRPVTMQEVVGASMFLLENDAMDGVNLDVDGGWLLR